MSDPVKCEEAALGLPFYLPHGKPADHMVRWKGRDDPAVPMCWMCTDHNVRNRGGEIVEGAELVQSARQNSNVTEPG